MSEKPQTRLVSKGRYAWMVVGRTTLLSVSILCFLSGASLAFVSALLLLFILFYSGWTSEMAGFLSLLALFSGSTFLLAFYFYKKESRVERVAPITKRTTSSLPPEQSLVRASDIPASYPQTELLRVPVIGRKTPAEELLRAATPNERE